MSNLSKLARPLPFTEANKILVSSLYYRSLKLANNWINKRDHYRQKAIEIRTQFDLHKNVSNPQELRRLIDKTESLLEQYKHPDPYIPPQRPGGTKYDRNIPPSLQEPYPMRY